MFSRVYAAKRAIQTASQDVWVLRDRMTHRELFRGPREKCEALQNGFGQSYITLP